MLSDINHSDDEMYFLTAPAFVNYAFDDKMKKTFEGCYLHWEIERSGKILFGIFYTPYRWR